MLTSNLRTITRFPVLIQAKYFLEIHVYPNVFHGTRLLSVTRSCLNENSKYLFKDRNVCLKILNIFCFLPICLRSNILIVYVTIRFLLIHVLTSVLWTISEQQREHWRRMVQEPAGTCEGPVPQVSDPVPDRLRQDRRSSVQAVHGRGVEVERPVRKWNSLHGPGEQHHCHRSLRRSG